MTTLDASTLSLLRMDVGDTGTPPAFSDAELQTVYDAETANYDRTVLRVFKILLANSYKFTDYTQNASSERKSQIFDHLKALYDQQLQAVQKGNQVRIVGSKVNPPKQRDMPDDQPSFDDPAWRRIR